MTWCGDGVIDTDYEVCDPEDAGKSGWGISGCSNTCQPENGRVPLIGVQKYSGNTADTDGTATQVPADDSQEVAI